MLSELDRGKREGGEEALAPGSALVIDEAAMVDSARLARLIEHAEQAQAKLVLVGDAEQADQAFVMVDPSMDKQELYVAASRSRGETFIYATPEIQSHREEIAPMPGFSRDAIPHIAEAVERDRAQIAAHDAALRSQFSGLPTEELVARSEDLRIAASSEADAERQLRDLQEQIERVQRQIERYDAQRERALDFPRFRRHLSAGVARLRQGGVDATKQAPIPVRVPA